MRNVLSVDMSNKEKDKLIDMILDYGEENQIPPEQLVALYQRAIQQRQDAEKEEQIHNS